MIDKICEILLHNALKCVIIKLVEFFRGAEQLETLHKELRFAAVCTLALDVLVWLGSLLFIGIGFAVPLGLLLGSAAMLCNLWLLSRSIRNAVYHGRTRDFGGYLLRCGISCGVIAIGMAVGQACALAVILPFLYPKIIFGLLCTKKEKKR